MQTPERHRPIRALLLVGAAYFVIGIVLAALANASTSARMRFMWRLSAYVVSAAVFALHFGYERFRVRSTPRATASRLAAAVALGAFMFAVSANVHALRAGGGNRALLALALVVWPALGAAPAFAVALAAAAALAWRRRTP